MLRLFLTAALLLAPALCLAAESAPVTSRRATATLMSDTDAIAPGQPFRLALRLRLAPGWHTYWRNPGDAGAPPQLTLSLPPHATASEIAWPTPARQREGPLMTYGYQGDVVLPVTVTGAAAGGMNVTAQAQWLVCDNICVPEDGSFTLHLPQGTPAPSAEAALFRATEAHTPRPAPWQARIGPDGTLDVAGVELAPATVKAAAFIPDESGAIQDAAPQPLSVSDGHLQLHLAAAKFAPLAGLLLVTDATGQAGSYAITAAPAPELHAALPLARVLWLAFLGGAILNLMPCVFPVLAMKALGLARLSAAERGHARAHALSYTAGILVTFAGLCAVMLALRAGGAAAGWGFQFQSPAFVAAMAALLFAAGLNLAGVFAIDAGRAGIGQALAARGGHVGSFFTGLLAVLVATPCTAPFMAVAIGAALLASPLAAISVFLALGLGLASPYLLLAAIPALTRLLPRPGPWMETLRRVLAIPMIGAAAWLVWVVGQGWGETALALTCLGLLAVAAATLALRRAQRARGGRATYAGLALAVVAVVAFVVAVGASPPSSAPVAERGGEPFSAARLAALQSEGRPVFVNMTAAWCVTCLVNERLALSPDAVREAFKAHRVAYLKGDWTRQDPQITAFLQAHGREGVPLYVYFPGDGRPPSVLPQILTEGEVLAAVAG
ncbi:MAG TPA: protein-disulfide reductase DsbD domain-containing protein [Acetobacteraceae bacterium]|nr:protein-disulfide reductase DsbD domain-containing protein [Acetobacteraceae bacterium]